MALPGMRVSEAREASPLEWVPVRPVAGAVGGVAVVATFAKLGLTGEAVVSAFLISVLVVLAVIDLEDRELPNVIVLPSFVAVLLANVALFPDKGVEWILAAIGTAVLLLVPALIRRGTIGMGDVKLGLLLGAGLGMDVVQALLIGLLAAWPLAGYMLLRDGRDATRLAVPLAPFLAIGAIAAVLLD
jgi:prepilin signal peptidase PulO-like enzyme (type II secretory pathway)